MSSGPPFVIATGTVATSLLVLLVRRRQVVTGLREQHRTAA
jgi:hypothetical protein